MMKDYVVVLVPEATGTSSSKNIVLPDGSCNKCLKQVQDATITCRMCRETFHATGCDKDTDMCGKTFLRMYRYLTTEKASGEAKPGSFGFICKACLSVFGSPLPPVQNTAERKPSANQQDNNNVVEDEEGTKQTSTLKSRKRKNSESSDTAASQHHGGKAARAAAHEVSRFIRDQSFNESSPRTSPPSPAAEEVEEQMQIKEERIPSPSPTSTYPLHSVKPANLGNLKHYKRKKQTARKSISRQYQQEPVGSPSISSVNGAVPVSNTFSSSSSTSTNGTPTISLRTVEVSDVEDAVSGQETTPQVVSLGGFFHKSFKLSKKGVPYELQVDDIPGNEPLPKEECLKKLVSTLNNMDPKWDVIVADIVDTLVVVRLPCFHTEDFDAWMLEFSNLTKTSWNVFKRFHNKVRYGARRIYQCHLNQLKTQRNRPAKSRKKLNSLCPSVMEMKIRLVTKATIKGDPLVATHPCTVRLDWSHNHSFDDIANLRNRRIDENTKSMFFQYFKTMTASQAFYYHQQKLLDINDTQLFADKAQNPPYNTVYYLWAKYREQTGFGTKRKYTRKKLPQQQKLTPNERDGQQQSTV